MITPSVIRSSRGRSFSGSPSGQVDLRRADALHDLAIALDVVAPKGGHEQLARRGMGGPLSTITEFLPHGLDPGVTEKDVDGAVRTLDQRRGPDEDHRLPTDESSGEDLPYRLDADSRNHLVRVWVRKSVTMPG